MGAIEDFRVRLSATRHADKDALKKAREEFAKGYLVEWAGHVQAQLGEPFVGGASLQVSDLKLFVVMTPLMKGSMDHVPAAVFGDFPKLSKHYDAVKAHPKVTEWYAR